MASQTPLISAETRRDAFPLLTPAQIERVRGSSTVRQVKAGDILFEPGDADVPFFVLLSGRMEIVQPDRHAERLIVDHVAGEFTGEMTMITGRRAWCAGGSPKTANFCRCAIDDLKALVVARCGTE